MGRRRFGWAYMSLMKFRIGGQAPLCCGHMMNMCRYLTRYTKQVVQQGGLMPLAHCFGSTHLDLSVAAARALTVMSRILCECASAVLLLHILLAACGCFSGIYAFISICVRIKDYLHEELP